MTATNTTTNTQDVSQLFQDAYAATTADRAGLTLNDLLPVNLDAQTAINTVFAVMPQLNTLRAEIAAKFPAEEGAELDKAETYARALAYAQTVYLAASAPPEVLPELAERATKLREFLVSDAKALALRGLVDPKPLAELKGGTGYLAMASDLGVLVRMLRDRWSTISEKSAVQATELDEAERIFVQITMANAARSRQSIQVAAAGEDRQRAFTLLLNAYDRVRRMAAYLRWDAGDADKFAPSLWAGRGGRGAGTDVPSKTPAIDPTATTEPGPAPAATHAPAVGAGMPGGSPFSDN